MKYYFYLYLIINTSVLFGINNSSYKINHLEPPSWWTGMLDSSLQLMVHGENISDLEPSIKYPGVIISSVQKLKNPNYLFIDLFFLETVEPGSFEIIFKKESKELIKYNYEMLKKRPSSNRNQGFSQKDVIYLITPDRFANSDPENDSINRLKESSDRKSKYGRHGGDIAGVIDNLDYIYDMGFTQIWLNPLLENDQESYSYHGYSTTDYYNIDPRFGNNLLYQKLSVLASEKGIGIIKDMILNHIGSEHWWMSDLPTQDWINNGAKFKISSHNHQSVHDPYISENEKKDFTDGWFDRTMPDLNQSNPYLAKYLVQNSIWWIEYANLSGFRVDTYPYIDKKFLSMWGERIINEYPNFSFVGEEWSNDPSMVAYWQRGSKRYDSYVSYVPCMMDFPLQQALINALLSKESWNSGLIDIYKILASDYVYGNPYDLVVFAGNHDIKRIYSQLNKKIELLKMAMGFILTTRGIPQIYYGTEIAMQSSKDHGDIRSDFPGGWKGDKSNAFNSKGLKSWELEAQDYLKRLLKWRGKSEAVTKGSLIHYKPSDGLYTYFRLFNNEVVMVIVNNNKDKKFLDLERFKDILKGKKKGISVYDDKKINIDKKINVPAKTTFILDLY